MNQEDWSGPRENAMGAKASSSKTGVTGAPGVIMATTASFSLLASTLLEPRSAQSTFFHFLRYPHVRPQFSLTCKMLVEHTAMNGQRNDASESADKPTPFPPIEEESQLMLMFGIEPAVGALLVPDISSVCTLYSMPWSDRNCLLRHCAP